jgi:hypothetical protein
MAEINIDMVVRDADGCLTVAGSLRLLERLMRSLERTHTERPSWAFLDAGGEP